MSGFGERFRKAGYEIPKPLIEVERKPIIGHVIDMFPGETNFTFICNQDHLDNPDYEMELTLRNLCPTGQIIGIPSHKLGPVHAVLEIESFISDNEQTIVNYCDFNCYWDWKHFKNFVEANNCDGSIPSYKGFHPHTLGSTNYAYMQESEGWVKDIQEKKPYTDNRMEEYASSGTYYFSSGKLMKEAFHSQIDLNLEINGEFYVSLSYKPLLKANKRISVYPLQHFMQWGTPGDLHEYNYWSRAFSSLSNSSEKFNLENSSNIIPMAGFGTRFKNEGYEDTKPLIQVSGESMVVQAVNDLPSSKNNVFVIRSDMAGYEKVSSELLENYPGSIIKEIDYSTDGQAVTALIGFKELISINNKNISPVTIGVCDSGAIYDKEKFQNLLNDNSVDVIVWGIREYANAIRNPEMYGWIDSDNKGVIENISVKTPLSNPSTDPIILGIFTFKKSDDCLKVVNSLLDRDGKINGELYMDSCIEDAINLGLNCVLFEVDSFLCWGTPNDLKTFEYWQSCFHLWSEHPYKLEKDKRVSKNKIESIQKIINEKNPITNFSLGGFNDQ
tara:strand:+ start:5801 stop:7471 length:1671 start_codon:yes stop_codon:yes gene_type:complete